MLKYTIHDDARTILEFFFLTYLGFSSKSIVFCEKEHAMAYLFFSHGNAGAIPITLFDFYFFVFVKPARTQGGTQIDLVLGQSLDDNGWNRFLLAQFCLCPFEVRVREGRHGLGGLFDLGVAFLGRQTIALQMKSRQTEVSQGRLLSHQCSQRLGGRSRKAVTKGSHRNKCQCERHQ